MATAILAVIAIMSGSGAESAPIAASRPAFKGSISAIPGPVKKRMTSWHRGCPVHLRDLRLVRVTRWGFDRRAHGGRLIVHEDHARGIRHVMRVLYRRKYPIRRLRLIDAYGSNDRRSMAADNTSAFNCRFVAGTTRWSMHAYGLAIDVNPVENPYVQGRRVSPPAGRAYVDRSAYRKGMAMPNGVLVRAFASIGWKWGASFGDYQHFSTTGR
jgi:hypothetical protein